MIEPSVESMGYELVHMALGNGPDGCRLRIYIDAPGGIRVDDCEAVSRQVSAILDVEDPVSGSYILEVSSPGLNRPLVTPEHFRRFAGSRARIVMDAGMSGRRRFIGLIVEALEDSVVVESEGENFELPYLRIESARLEPVF